LVIPDSVTGIGDYAFYGCGGLTGALVIPDSVIIIGNSAFVNCQGLTSMSIGDGVTGIGDEAFSNCTGFTAITVGNGNANYKDIDGVLFSKGGKALIKYPASKTGTYYAVSGDVTSIGEYAFAYCGGLTGVVIGNGVTDIGEYAFYGCRGLASAVIPAGVTDIGVQVFLLCDELTGITVDGGNASYKDIDGVLFTKDGKTLIQYPEGKTGASYTVPDGVESIGRYAFFGNNLTSVTIPAGVTDIGVSAFYAYNQLTTVNYCGTEAEWNAITIEVNNDRLLNATINYGYTGA
jgi:hypothetical protein